MAMFLTHLREKGIYPAEVITDGSSLYPIPLKKIWPTAVHQLCLFHETRHVTKAVMEVIQDLRKELPSPPPAERKGKGGPIVNHPPSENPDDPAVKRWHLRRDERQAGIIQIQQLTHQGLSQRAISRQTGLNRRTVQKWLQEEVSEPEIGNESIVTEDKNAEIPENSPKTDDTSQPPAPWTDWGEVHQVHETLQEHRFLFLKRPCHLTEKEKEIIANLLDSPVGGKLQVPYAFLKDWYAFWNTPDQKIAFRCRREETDPISNLAGL